MRMRKTLAADYNSYDADLFGVFVQLPIKYQHESFWMFVFAYDKGVYRKVGALGEGVGDRHGATRVLQHHHRLPRAVGRQVVWS